MFNRERLFYSSLITWVVVSIVWNSLVSVWLYHISDLPQKIEAYYMGDAFLVREVSDDLVLDIEKAYQIKMPKVELFVNLAERSKTGITYDDDNKTLHLYISPRLFLYSEGKLRAYFAHEFSHYTLSHFRSQQPNNYSFYGSNGDRNIQAEIDADIRALEFSKKENLVEVINDLVWGNEKEDEERKRRLAILINSQ